MTRAPCTLAAAAASLCIGSAYAQRDALPPDAVRVAMATYGGGEAPGCFSTLFLHLVGYETDIEVDPTLHEVAADDPALFDHPFAVMSGEGAFSLSDDEAASLRAYLARGGFLLASPSCSNAAWGSSFQRAMERILPEEDARVARRLLTPEDEVFRAVYDLSELTTTDMTPAVLVGVEIDGRLALVYSPQGLNDTSTAGGGCCCCGASEIREARFLNANMLVYALTQ